MRGRPGRDHKLDKLEFRNFICGGLAKTTNLTIWTSKNFVRGRPRKKPYDSKDHTSLTNWSSKLSSVTGQQTPQVFQNFIRGRPSKNHKPHNLGFQNFVRGRSAKTTNLELMVFAGTTPDEILELQIVRLVVFAGPAMDEFWNSSLSSLWSLLGLLRTKFWNSRL